MALRLKVGVSLIITDSPPAMTFEPIIIINTRSMFFHKQQIIFLAYHQGDNTIIIGSTTSGCMKITVNDAFEPSCRAIALAMQTKDTAYTSGELELPESPNGRIP